MAYITTLLEVGGMLNVPIPRALVRELRLVKRARVVVSRQDGDGLLVQILDDYLAQRKRVRRDRA